MKVHNWKIEIISFVVKFRGLGIGQGMKQTYVYLWYPLFQAQWDR